IEREGKNPPMTAIRETLYSLLERPSVDPRAVNLLGFFSALDPGSDLLSLMRDAGIRTVHQIAAKETLEDYYEMGKANFNIVLHPEAVPAAVSLQKRLGMPFLELHRLYDPERIHNQYKLFGAAVGVTLDDEVLYEACIARRDAFAKRFAGASVVIGEMCNANPYELAAFLTSLGLDVREIHSNLTAYDVPFVKQLAAVSPGTKVFTGISPSMVHYEPDPSIDVTIGKDAAVCCPDAKHVLWNSEQQPFGYTAVNGLLTELEEVLA
ncbi:MAG: oxidoreductase, partial [Clostridia bacterium]|nr:oxidoreductase [Clostridia bacterium]